MDAIVASGATTIVIGFVLAIVGTILNDRRTANTVAAIGGMFFFGGAIFLLGAVSGSAAVQ